jgi:Fe-S oxidoreductase
VTVFKAEHCNLCGDCLVRCMFNSYSRQEAVAERRALMAGKWAPILSNCADCHACNEFCPQGANPWDLVSRLQGLCGEATTSTVWGERAKRADEERSKLRGELPLRPVEVVLATCTIGELNPNAFESVMYEGLPRLVGPAYYCCQALEFFGDEEGVRARAQGFVDAISRHGPKEVVCYHDACYYLLTFRALEYGIRTSFRPVHIFEHLLRTLRKHVDRIRPLNLRLAYQRPCSSRNTQEKEPFLDELFALIGCERVARRYDRDQALCCGDIYAFRGRSDRAEDAALRNIRDCLTHGAEALVYLCPSCAKLYGRLCGNWNLPVYQISELCQMALGEKPR